MVKPMQNYLKRLLRILKRELSWDSIRALSSVSLIRMECISLIMVKNLPLTRGIRGVKIQNRRPVCQFYFCNP
jgi:hypothetical protein